MRYVVWCLAWGDGEFRAGCEKRLGIRMRNYIIVAPKHVELGVRTGPE